MNPRGTSPALYMSDRVVVKPAARLTPKCLPTPRHKGRRYRGRARGQARREGPGGPRGRLPSARSLRFFSAEEMHVTNSTVRVRGFVMIEACDSSSPPSAPRSLRALSTLSRFSSLLGAPSPGNYANSPFSLSFCFSLFLAVSPA